MASSRLVVVDTDVWSYLFAAPRRQDPRIAEWRRLLRGRSVTIAVQTRAEVLTGIRQRDLGARTTALITDQLDKTPTIPVDEAVVQAYAVLTAESRSLGHALSMREHAGDRWIAATAIAADAPLLSGDGVYRSAPSLVLLDELPGRQAHE